MRAWTLSQLKFAHEVCFRETFEEIWAKNDPDGLAYYLSHQMVRAGGLLPWIFQHSRHDFGQHGFGDQLDALLIELVGDYQ